MTNEKKQELDACLLYTSATVSKEKMHKIFLNFEKNYRK